MLKAPIFKQQKCAAPGGGATYMLSNTGGLSLNQQAHCMYMFMTGPLVPFGTTAAFVFILSPQIGLGGIPHGTIIVYDNNQQYGALLSPDMV